MLFKCKDEFSLYGSEFYTFFNELDEFQHEIMYHMSCFLEFWFNSSPNDDRESSWISNFILRRSLIYIILNENLI